MVNNLQDYQYSKLLPSTPSIGGTRVVDPSYVHLSFGYPSSDLFPIHELSEAASEAILQGGRFSLHYFGGNGPKKVKDWIQQRSHIRSIQVETDQVLITAGAMQAIEVAARVLINPEDEVWVEGPTYFNGLQAFRLAGAKIKTFPIDENGLRVDLLEDALQDARLQNKKIPKFIYAMPNFHNPGGVNLSLERRKRLAELAREYNFYILEDDAYGELSFTNQYLPSIYSFAPDNVIYVSTFSKIIGPGLRLGWVIANNSVLEKINVLMLGSQTNPFTLEIIAHLLDKISFEDHLDRLISVYRKKRDIMIDAIQENFGHHVSFNVPLGGFFCGSIFVQKSILRSLQLKRLQMV